jgi:glycosyltransferase involved in cell wall biosynthesis
MRPVRTPISGVARHCIDLALALKARHEFEIYGLYRGNRSTNEALRSVEGIAAISSVSHVSPKILNLVLEFLPAFSSTVIDGKFDIVHETFFGNIGSKRKGKKVVTIHDIIPIENPAYFNYKNVIFTRRNFKRQCREADHIFSDSHYTKKKILEYASISEDKISIVPVGFTTTIKERDPQFLVDNGIADRRFLLYVGNIEPRKNIGLIARALKQLGPNFDDMHVVVAGHKNFAAQPIIDESKELLGNRFHFLGFVTETQKWTLLQAATAFVLPSFYEGFGIPIVECYRVRCPVLIANNSSLPELAVDERQLFDAHSVASLAARLTDLLGNPPWVQAAVQKATDGLGRFDYTSIAQDTAEVYKRVLSS